MTESYFDDDFDNPAWHSSPIDWNYDDEMIDPSPADAWGYLPTFDSEEDDFDGVETTDVFPETSAISQSEQESDPEEAYLSPKNLLDSRKNILQFVKNNDFISARKEILKVLQGLHKPSKERSNYFRKLFGSYLTSDTFDLHSMDSIFNQFKQDITKSDIGITKSEVEAIRNSMRIFGANISIDQLDSSNQLASVLRRDFDRPDLAYQVLKPWMFGVHENSPHLNTTLLPILIENGKFRDAEMVAERLMRFAPIVHSSMPFALPAYSNYLLTMFKTTGDFTYAEEAETILAVMTSAGVPESIALKCQARYFSILGEKELSHNLYEDALLDESEESTRKLSPSAVQYLENSKVGIEFANWINGKLKIAKDEI
jgi:hypothetical protein